MGESDTQKSVPVKERRRREERPPHKVVIRGLPPSMTEESFLEEISPMFDHDYFCFVPPSKETPVKEAFATAYINFLNLDDVFVFTEKFDGYVFVDGAGHEYVAIVEFAPFQRIPKLNRKEDPLSGTILEDECFANFLADLHAKEEEDKIQGGEHYFNMEVVPEVKVTSTPLLEFIAKKKEERVKFSIEKRKREQERRIRLKEDTRSKLTEDCKKKIKEDYRQYKQNSDARWMNKSRHNKNGQKLEFKGRNMSEDVEKNENGKGTPVATRTKRKSYQEERQRDLERRKRGQDQKEEVAEKSSPREDLKTIEEVEEKAEAEAGDEKGKGRAVGRPAKKIPGGLQVIQEEYGRDADRNWVSRRWNGGDGRRFDKWREGKKLDEGGKGKESVKAEDWRMGGKRKDEGGVKQKGLMREELEGVDRAREKGGNQDANRGRDHDRDKGRNNRDSEWDRRIKNKDRPALQIYRPGMGKFSRQSLEKDKQQDDECKD